LEKAEAPHFPVGTGPHGIILHRGFVHHAPQAGFPSPVTAEPANGFTLNGTLAYLHAAYDKFQTLDSAGNTIDLTAQPFSAPK